MNKYIFDRVEDLSMNIEEIRDYVDGINLEDYELGGVEITDDDFETIAKRMANSNKSLEETVDEYLFEIREVLDDGLEEIIMGEKQKIYDELCAVLTRYEESDEDESELLYEMLCKIQNRWEDTITAQ